MENKNDNYIKMDGKFNQFEGGAIRYNKDKGRFDLIPERFVSALVKELDICVGSIDVQLTPGHIISECFEYGVTNATTTVGSYDLREALLMTILDITIFHYSNTNDCINFENNKWSYKNRDLIYISRMLKDLAIHYQKGAEKYGERNCERGIPLWSFIDSGRRHLCQYFIGEKDEPHHISAIWNFAMAWWTIVNEIDKNESNTANGLDIKSEVTDSVTTEEPDDEEDDCENCEFRDTCFNHISDNNISNNAKNNGDKISSRENIREFKQWLDKMETLFDNYNKYKD